MLLRLLSPAFSVLLLAADARAAVVGYAKFGDTNAIVTGVRSDSATSDSVVLTANYTAGGVQYAGLYQGSLAAVSTAPSSSWHLLTPNIADQTVTAATFYGPNTSRYNPGLGAGNVIAVGSYKYSESSEPAANHGLLYQGPVDGSGAWMQIDATSLVPEGDTLKNTIAHSNMGILVVGDYDTQLDEGRAFIYNRMTGAWTNLNPGGTESVTAYGIWQNGGADSTSYTIAGGQGNLGPGELEHSYLVDYDSATGNLSNYRVFDYNNEPEASQVAHFDGITATATGYNLTGTVTDGPSINGFFATVTRNGDGSFGEATWTEISYPGGSETTGNTIVENKVLGIFVSDASSQSYLATVAPDRTGVAVSVAKSGTRATFTVRNTGNVNATFRLRATSKITNKPGKPANGCAISFQLNGSGATKAIESGKAGVTLAPGATAKVVETVKSIRKDQRHTVRTTLRAAATTASAADSAAVSLVLKAK